MALKGWRMILLLCTCSCVFADDWPGGDRYYDICLEIYNAVSANNIPFRYLRRTCSWWSCRYELAERERLTRYQLCDKLTNKHNTHNAGYVGTGSIFSTTCQIALANPAPYQAADWNSWAGKHCGDWYSDGGVSSGDVDNAVWYNAGPNNQFTRQNVHFSTRTNCQNCHNGWNESGGGVSLSTSVPMQQPCIASSLLFCKPFRVRVVSSAV